MTTLFIDWNPSIEVFTLGSLTVRWYALCWMAGLAAAYLIVRRLYQAEGIDPVRTAKGKWEPTGKFDPLVFYAFIGVVLGARLGHCLFYEPDYFLSSGKHIIEMLLPIRFAPDSWSWKMVGYSGLASHGGAAGLFIALLLYVRRTGVGMWRVLDMIALVAPLTSFFIRIGNLMNSEIIGKPTDMPWGFVFHTSDALVDGQLAARHPSQLYEALAYLLIFFIGWRLYRGAAASAKDNEAAPTRRSIGSGFYFGFCLTTIFLFRFFIEFLKEVQGGTDDGSTVLDMGQMLSLPFVLVGLFCMWRLLGIRNNK